MSTLTERTRTLMAGEWLRLAKALPRDDTEEGVTMQVFFPHVVLEYRKREALLYDVFCSRAVG
jgi:hypothetical protein